MGPTAFAIISKGFGNRIREGRAIAYGAAFMDFFYCLMAFGGIALMISIVPSGAAKIYAKNAHWIEIVLTFAGCAIVTISGLKIMRQKITYTKLETEEAAKYEAALIKASKLREKAENVAEHLKIKEIRKSNLGGSFFTGLLLCVSLTLPASWIAIVGYLKGYEILDPSFLGGLLFSMGVFAGTSAWYYTLLRLIAGNKKRINETTINKLNISSGVILLMLGVLLFVKATVSVFSMM